MPRARTSSWTCQKGMRNTSSVPAEGCGTIVPPRQGGFGAGRVGPADEFPRGFGRPFRAATRPDGGVPTRDRGRAQYANPICRTQIRNGLRQTVSVVPVHCAAPERAATRWSNSCTVRRAASAWKRARWRRPCAVGAPPINDNIHAVSENAPAPSITWGSGRRAWTAPPRSGRERGPWTACTRSRKTSPPRRLHGGRGAAHGRMDGPPAFRPGEGAWDSSRDRRQK